MVFTTFMLDGHAARSQLFGLPTTGSHLRDQGDCISDTRVAYRESPAEALQRKKTE